MDIRKFAMHYGSILGSIFVFIGLLCYLFGIYTFKIDILYKLTNTIVMIVFLTYCLKLYKSSNINQLFNYNICVKVGISICVFSAFLFGLWKALLVHYIQPDFTSLSVDYAQQKIIQFDNQFPDFMQKISGQSTDDMLQELDYQRTPLASYMIFFREIINKALGGFILSSIIYLFIKDKFSELKV